MTLNYEQDINISEHDLDVEWLEQPRLMIKYGENAARAKREADHAKEAVEVKKAELDRDIRADPEKYGISKITETVVQNTISLQDEYQEAMTKYINAKHEFDMARYAVQAMQDRKEALENLVKLHGQMYFAGPSAPRDLSNERQKREAEREKQKESNKKVGSGMKRKK